METSTSRSPTLDRSENLLRNLIAPVEDLRSDSTVQTKHQIDTSMNKEGYHPQTKAQAEKVSTIKMWSPAQIVLSITTLMLVERGSLDVDEKVSKYWPEYVEQGEKDIPVKTLLSHSLVTSENDNRLMTKDISELLRRSDGRSLEQFVTDEIATPLQADLDRRVMVEGREESRSQGRPDTVVPLPETADIETQRPSKSNVQSQFRPGIGKLYPKPIPSHPLHPYACDFSVVPQGQIGKALITHRRWQQGDFMARFDGMTVPEVMLHTLQKTDHVHLWDPHFVGNLAHSCDPNVMVDMAEQELWAVQDIEAGTVLSMDYASTEDRLFRTFQCECTALNCRGEVTGRKQRRNGFASVSQKCI